jgi:signal peptidase
LLMKWISRAVTLLMVILFFSVLISTVSSRINGGAPRFFGKEIMSVLSGSMEPGIKTGSIIAVEPVGLQQRGSFKPGDVITFKSPEDPNILITHRIVSVKNTGNDVAYTTKGDNNDGNDTRPVPSGNVVARYADFTIPFLGFILAWVKSKVGIAVVMIIPGIVLIVSSLVTIFRTIMLWGQAEEKKKALLGESPMGNG